MFYKAADGISVLVKKASKKASWLSLLGLIVLSACSTGGANYVPVKDLPQPPSIRIQKHEVMTGETLFSLAWRYNLDYRGLACANSLGSPYRIYPGQKLTLSDRCIPKRSKNTQKMSQKVSETKKSTGNPQGVKKISAPPPKTVINISKSGRIVWQWPAKGRVIKGFSLSKRQNKGIDIAGELREPVHASANGEVVYAGDGLLGYGNLIIVKHSEQFLSAYAHNSRLLVSEGDRVRAGQKIALMGSSGTNNNKLHFEIRRDGKPVDPLRYLPRR